ncbi:hypothetical protein JCM3765_006376 [Sporobolomyces pararoseus]
MPPRSKSTTASSSSSSSKVEKKKRSPSSDLSEEEPINSDKEEEEPPKKKKQKKKEPAVKKGPVTPIHPELPNNTTLPDPLEPFPKPFNHEKGVLRISSWNVAGLKACEKKGFSKYVEAEDADILCLNEHKSQQEFKIDSIDSRYPYRYWGIHHKKGQAGVSIFSKIKPLNVTKGIPPPFSSTQEEEVEEGKVRGPSQEESKGRIITLEFENNYLIATYVPNAGQGLKNLAEKAAWNKTFENYLFDLDSKKPVIWIGDLNVVPTELDIRNWKTNYNKSAGVTDTEIKGFKSQLKGPPPTPEGGERGFIDVWREKNPNVIGNYSYFSYKFQCRSKGIGWRIDFAIVSKRIFEKVETCEIRQSIYGASDHVPIVIDIQGPL